MNTSCKTIVCAMALALVLGCNAEDTGPEPESTTTHDEVQTTPTARKDVHPTLRRAELDLKRLGEQGDERLLLPLGFADQAECDRAKPGLQLPVYAMRTPEPDSAESSDSEPLVDIETRVTLVTVDDEPRSLMYHAKHEGEWVMTRAGGAEYAERISAAVIWLYDQGLEPSAMMLVEARAVGRTFIGYRQGDELMLLPVERSVAPVPLHEVRGELFKKPDLDDSTVAP